MSSRTATLIALLFALAARPAATEVRPGTFRSAALDRELSYVVDVPPSYDGSGDRRYPVVYALLFAEGTVTSWSNRFRLDSAQSYVPMETRQKDPAFWMPKAAAKAPAKKP